MRGRTGHACGVRTGFWNILSAGGSTLVPGDWSAVTRLLPHHHRDCSQHSGFPPLCSSYCALLCPAIEEIIFREMERTRTRLVLTRFASIENSVMLVKVKVFFFF